MTGRRRGVLRSPCRPPPLAAVALPAHLVIAVAVEVELATPPRLPSTPRQPALPPATFVGFGGRRRWLESSPTLRAPPPRHHAASVNAGARLAEFPAAGWITKAPRSTPPSRGALDHESAEGWIRGKPPLKFEHQYLVPDAKQARAHLETADLWLERSKEYLRPPIGLGSLPARNFHTSSRGSVQTYRTEFVTPSTVAFFWDAKKQILTSKADGTLSVVSFADLSWKELVRRQKPFYVARDGFHLQPKLVTKLFKEYERWLKRHLASP